MSDLNEIIARYEPHFTAHNARVYARTPAEDTLLLRWWIRLNETGDIARLVTPGARRLPDFLALYAAPTALIYSLSPNGEITRAVWFTPADQSSQSLVAYCGLWIDSTVRTARSTHQFVTICYQLAFEFYSAILGQTWQADLLDIHTKLGYNVVGCIPNLYDQPHVYIVHLTREAFYNSRLFRIAQRR